MYGDFLNFEAEMKRIFSNLRGGAVVAALVSIPFAAQALDIITNAQMQGIKLYEVFQRDGITATSTANIQITPTFTPQASYTRFRVSILKNGVLGTVLNSDAYSAGAKIQFKLSTGMEPGQVRISFLDNSNVERGRWDSPLFSVGDVFIVAGQSNAASHGWFQDSAPVADTNRAFNPETGQWELMRDPMPFASNWKVYPWRNDTLIGASPWINFTRKWNAKAGVPVGIINVAWGGSAVAWWEPNAWNPDLPSPLWNRLKLAADTVKRPVADSQGSYCGYRAVLWHQGESDSMNQTTDKVTYATRLTNVAKTFISATSCHQPWVVAKASWQHDVNWSSASLPKKWQAETDVRKAQAYLASRQRRVGEPVFKPGPDTDLMVGAANSRYRWDDSSHFSATGLNIHGELWSERVWQAIGGVNFKAEIELVPEVRIVYDAMKTNLKRSAAEMTADKEGLRYWTQQLVLGFVSESNLYSIFINSDEVFVRATFASTLKRAPTATETSYWIGVLAGDVSKRGSLAGWLVQTVDETRFTARQKEVWNLYLTVLNRTQPEMLADMAGFNYWANSSETLQNITSNLQASDEYKVRTEFDKIHARQPKPAELSKVLSAMGNDATYRTDPIKLQDLIWINNFAN